PAPPAFCRPLRPAHPVFLGARLVSFHPNVAEFAKVLIEGGYWQIFGYGSSCDQAVHKVDLCGLETSQGVQMSGELPNLDSRARYETRERRGDARARMLIEGLKHEYALGKYRGQYDNDSFPSVACFKQPASRLRMLLVVLNQIADDQVGIYELPLTHRSPRDGAPILRRLRGLRKMTSPFPSCWPARPSVTG